MKYLAAHFEIACMDDMMQIARDLLMDVAGEAGFESFEDTERGVDGYVQEQLFDRQLLDDGIASFPLDGVSKSWTRPFPVFPVRKSLSVAKLYHRWYFCALFWSSPLETVGRFNVTERPLCTYNVSVKVWAACTSCP